MLQLGSIIQDAELGAAPFTVQRKVFWYQQGSPVLFSTTEYAVTGTVHPASQEDLLLLPEEYRHSPVYTFYSPTAFSLGWGNADSTFTAPDEILHDGKRYRVINVKDWLPQGFCKAQAVLVREEGE